MQRSIPNFFLVMLMALSFYSYADTVYLKNGRQIEGKILNEKNENVEVDIGLGTVTVSRNDIEHVQKSEIIRAEPEPEMVVSNTDDDLISGEIKEIYKKVKAVRTKRLNAIRYRDKYEALVYKFANIQKEITRLYGRYETLNAKLSRVVKGDVITNNKLVGEINVASSKISKMQTEAATTHSMKDEAETTMSKAVNDYHSELYKLSDDFKSFESLGKKRGLAKEEGLILFTIRNDISNMTRDFTRKDIGFSMEGDSVVVDVIFNNRVTGRLVVDTGASLVFISKGLADRIGIKTDLSKGAINCILADGSQSKAAPVVFDSVEVDGLRMKNVMGAVSCGTIGTGIDGLLGMSFLGNFVFRVDSKANMLIMEEFTPS